MRSAASRALLAVALVSCAGAGASAPGGTPVTFRDLGATAYSQYDGAAPKIEAVREGAGLRITVYQGQQRSGGYAITVTEVRRAGTTLRVVARFAVPPSDAITTQALSSPAHAIAVDTSADEVVLFDEKGAERARAAPR